jgi:quinol monooxygenase YgiN
MLILYVQAEVDPADLAALLPAAARMVAASNAEEGCIRYVFSRDLMRPELLHIVEVWRDQAALDHHFSTPHMAEFQAAIKGKINILAGDKYLAGDPLPLRG